MNNKYLRIFILSITALIVFSISGCSQNRTTRHVQHQQSKTPVYAPHSQSRHTSQQIKKPQHTKLRTQQSSSYNFQVRNRIVEIAQRSIGTRYLYGGRNPKRGFDCSGLMHYVHKQSLGIDIPRTAAEQRDRSRTISYAQLKPGDMLFFKTGKRTNHVGVYIGDRKFIHASTGSKRVKVAKMDSKYWHQRFVKFGTYL